MRRILLAVTGALAGWAVCAQSPPVIFPQPMSPRNADYAIEVTLDAKKHLLLGKETIRWRNLTQDTVADAWFHLYMNAFANNQSVFMKESSGQHRQFKFDDRHWGYCRVTSIRQQSGEARAGLEQEFPGADRTVMRVALAQPVGPGEETEFDVAFEVQLPKVFARAGFEGAFNMAGQWFPKLGVYQQGRGWNCHEYHVNSEFFSDFGVYDVSVTVPAAYVVGATGILWREVKNGETKTLSFHAEDVHDFAWVASPDFVEAKDRWRNVEIRVLMQPGNRDSIPRYIQSVRKALECYATWIWPYPYPLITVVDPPQNGEGAGGMEYPTLITAGASPFLPRCVKLPEMVTVHEFGHQYWYGMEANNEFEEAWLDEGINSYYETRILDAWFGPSKSMMAGCLGWNLGDVEFQRIQYMGVPDMDPVVLDSWKYYSGGAYAAMSYSKPALLLKTLEGLLGQEKMDEVMRAFFLEVKFTHPTTADFLRIVSRAAGRDLEPLLKPMLYGTGTVDFKVARVRNSLREKPRGFDLAADPPTRYSAEEKAAKGKKSEKKEGGGKGDGESSRYDAVVVVQRKGSLVVPVEVQVFFKDGTDRTERWDGEGRYTTFSYAGKKVSKVLIDPRNQVPLDLQRLNNGWAEEEDGKPARALTTKFRILFQGLLTGLVALL